MTARDETPDVALSEEELRWLGKDCRPGVDAEATGDLAVDMAHYAERMRAERDSLRAQLAAREAARAEAEARAEREQRASAAYHEKWGQCALRLEESEARVAAVEALAVADPPASPYTDVAEEALWRVGYTDAQTAILRVLLDARPDPTPEFDASGLPIRLIPPAPTDDEAALT